MRLLVLQAIVISALYQAAWAYDPWDMNAEEQLALEELLAEAGVGDFYPEAYYNPETRNEDPDTNKPVIPPNTFVAGGAGEGKQHLGPNLIPNKPRIVPEINPPVYDNPPNPCSTQDMETFTKEVESVSKAAMGIMCQCAADWDKEEDADCVDARKCCIPNMPNEADYVKQFQETGKAVDDNDIFQNLGYDKRTRFYEGEKRAGHVAKKAPVMKRNSFVDAGERTFHPISKMRKDRRNKYFEGPIKKTVVAKKAPNLSSGRLPIM